MTLIKSISGIRGTIGGPAGEGLSPLDIVKFTAAYADFIKTQSGKQSIRIVVGRDARISGDMVNNLVTGTLMGMGADVIDGGLSTTPTIEMAVVLHKADGGLILTASHNPAHWNALKLLDCNGEFLSAEAGTEVLAIAENAKYDFAPVHQLGKYRQDRNLIHHHIEEILKLQLVDAEAIRRKNFRITIDCVNSTGGVALPQLLEALGVKKMELLYCEPDGKFPHNPEPLPENLTEICELVKKTKSDIGFVVDPDVDRLAIITEKGEMFGEEYTLVAVADYVLQSVRGNTVSNLSSTRALKDITYKYGGQYFAAPVGEVNVVQKMKKVNAVIGGEGNGGVIYPALHYGRDALAGIALFLTFLAKSGKSCAELRAGYPEYFMSKNKIELTPGLDVDRILQKVAEKYKDEQVNLTDGVKIDFEKKWVHLRKSNTEPIIRIYTEAETKQGAQDLASQIMEDIRKYSA
ncbi:MAG: phosphoglucosamine mutase [Bacteroidales bacterium]